MRKYGYTVPHIGYLYDSPVEGAPVIGTFVGVRDEVLDQMLVAARARWEDKRLSVDADYQLLLDGEPVGLIEESR